MDGQTENNSVDIKPEVHAEKCPVCNGFGTLKWGEKVCQACGGKGYVVVPNYMDGQTDGNNLP